MTLPFQPLFGRIADAWSNLSDRERRLLALMAVALVLFLAAMGFSSMRRTIAQRQASIESKELSMQQIGFLAEGYSEAEAARARIEARIRGTPVRLFSYLDDLARKQNLSLGDMQDRGSDKLGDGITRSTVEVSFARIDLRTLTGFVNEIEKSRQLVKVEKLRVRSRTDDPNLVDASITVSTYSLNKG